MHFSDGAGAVWYCVGVDKTKKPAERRRYRGRRETAERDEALSRTDLSAEDDDTRRFHVRPEIAEWIKLLARAYVIDGKK